MRKAIVALLVVCAAILPLDSVALVSSSMRQWTVDNIIALIKAPDKNTFKDVFGNDFDAENCSTASFSRLVFGNNNIDAYQYKTIKEFAQTITTIKKEDGKTTCQFMIPYDTKVENPIVMRYTIGSNKELSFDITNKEEASYVLWLMAPWLLNEKQVDYLLEKGAMDWLNEYETPETNWKFYESTLCRYIYLNRPSVVKKLLDKGADVNYFCYASVAPDKDFFQSFAANPLTLSVHQSNLDMLKLLLQYGAEVKNVASVGTKDTDMFIKPEPIVESARNYEMLSLLLKQKNVDVNQYLVFGKTKFNALFLAIGVADLRSVELLISSGIDVNKVFYNDELRTVSSVWAVLTAAVGFREEAGIKVDDEKDQKILEMLIKAGVDYNSSFMGHTPLSFAKRYATKFVKIFEKYNAKEDVELLEHNWCTDNYGDKRICGKVKNNTDEEKNVRISFNFYDKDGYRIGNDFTSISNLEPGSVWKFDNAFPKDGTVTYKVVDIKTDLF